MSVLGDFMKEPLTVLQLREEKDWTGTLQKVLLIHPPVVDPFNYLAPSSLASLEGIHENPSSGFMNWLSACITFSVVITCGGIYPVGTKQWLPLEANHMGDWLHLLPWLTNLGLWPSSACHSRGKTQTSCQESTVLFNFLTRRCNHFTMKRYEWFIWRNKAVAMCVTC